MDDELENTVGFAIAKIIAGVLFADLDTNAIDLSWICASKATEVVIPTWRLALQRGEPLIFI